MLTFKSPIIEIVKFNPLNLPYSFINERVQKTLLYLSNNKIGLKATKCKKSRDRFSDNPYGPFFSKATIARGRQLGLLKVTGQYGSYRVNLSETGKEYIEFLKWRMRNE